MDPHCLAWTHTANTVGAASADPGASCCTWSTWPAPPVGGAELISGDGQACCSSTRRGLWLRSLDGSCSLLLRLWAGPLEGV